MLRWSFDPLTLTVTCTGSSSTSLRDASSALSAAADLLESRYGASIDRDLDHDKIRFGGSWRSGRSWLACVNNACIAARRDEELLLVRVSAALWPLLWIPVTGLMVLALFRTTWLLWVLPPLVLANYAFVHFAMRRLVHKALESY
jgi:hypothetical protein